MVQQSTVQALTLDTGDNNINKLIDNSILHAYNQHTIGRVQIRMYMYPNLSVYICVTSFPEQNQLPQYATTVNSQKGNTISLEKDQGLNSSHDDW